MLGITLSGRYKIVQHLGGGGFGQTYLAEDLQLPGNPLCVVKQLKPRSTDPLILRTAKRFFDREAQVLYKLGNHDQIPRLLAHFQQEQEFYLVQEFIEGHDLKQELPLGKRLSEAQVIVLCQDILKILEFVHQQDVIHRDIKPANIIRRKQDGKLVLIDFGAVKEVTTQTINPEGQTSLTVAIGSPGYMPNEQHRGKPQFCSDIYAIGMLGIQALTGINPKQLPEDAKTSEILWRDKWQHSTPPEQIQDSIKLADVLDKMVRYDYRMRYQTATEALQAFQQLIIAYSSSTTTSASQFTFTESADPFESTVTYPRPPQVASSQQDRIDDVESTQAPPSLQPARDLSEVQVGNETSKPSVSGSRKKSYGLLGIGAGIATALALTVGIYHAQQNDTERNVSQAEHPGPKSQGSESHTASENAVAPLQQELQSSSEISPPPPISPSPRLLSQTSNAWNNSEKISLANTLTGHSQKVRSIAMTPDSETLVSGSNWGKFSLWNLPNLVKGCKGVQPCRPTHILSGSNGGWVHSIAISPGGKTIATGSDRENTIKLWNASTGKPRITISNRLTSADALAFSPDGKSLVTNGEDGKIEIWRSP